MKQPSTHGCDPDLPTKQQEAIMAHKLPDLDLSIFQATANDIRVCIPKDYFSIHPDEVKWPPSSRQKNIEFKL